MSVEKCPACGHETLERKESKYGTFFWACSDIECGKSFHDDNGKIGRAYAEVLIEDCPSCGAQKAAKRREYRNKPGEFFWVCDACGTFSNDDGGKIGEDKDAGKPKGECPVCHGVALQCVSKAGKPYWRCKNDKSHGPFGDDNGKPGKPFGQASQTPHELCPHCRKEQAWRNESRNKPGNFYWRCKQCGNMEDKDGKPGKLFGGKK